MKVIISERELIGGVLILGASMYKTVKIDTK